MQAAAMPAPAPAKNAATERRAPTLAILATSLRMPHGASTEAFSAALAANQAHTELDQELIDDSGFPIMSARSKQAVDEALKEDIAEWLAANAMAELHLSDEQWRTLILGTATLRDLAGLAAAMLIPDSGETPTLQLMPVLPPGWQLAQRQAASAWWRHTLVQCGWPASHIAPSDQQADQQADYCATPPAALLARLAHAASTSPQPLATILLASASNIGQETVDRWSASQLLFTPAHPQGQVPGEGAAGLLLADARLVQAMDVTDLTYLDLECEACDPAFAGQKRISPQLLGKLAERALQGAALPALEIAMIVADTGPDTRHVLELIEFGTAATPHLDSSSDILRLGPACGSCGGVPFVAALALARHAALERKAPLLCVSNDMAALRAVALIRHSPQAGAVS
jgi:hypothetical protein